MFIIYYTIYVYDKRYNINYNNNNYGFNKYDSDNMVNKLIVMIMGQNCEKFIKMCLDSTEDADARIYCDGGSTDSTLDIVENRIGKKSIIHNTYDQDDKTMNGRQRNFYLKYLKNNYPDDWCLCLDADEVVEDLSKIKNILPLLKDGIYSVKMRHLIQDLAHEDAQSPEHFVLHRLFKIKEATGYPEIEHPLLQGTAIGATTCTTIWHLAYVPNMWDIKKRYDCHMKKSDMHTTEFLKKWYWAHLFGAYPKSQFNPVELPKVILDEFGIDKDELYFINRGLEVKHSIMVKQWNNYFKPTSVLDLGCGRGPYLFYWEYFTEYGHGIELSEYAVKNALVGGIGVGNVSDKTQYMEHDLITAIDILEHLTNEELDKTLKNMANNSKHFIFSIPYIGDSNLEADKSHIQKKTKEEWINLIESYGIKTKDVPSDWLFREQLLIGEKNA